MEIARVKRLDLDLLDVHMPGYNGLELFRRLRLIQTDLHCVFLTSEPSGLVIETARKLGALSVLAKAIHIKMLFQLVEMVTTGDFDNLLEIADLAGLLLDPASFRKKIRPEARGPRPEED